MSILIDEPPLLSAARHDSYSLLTQLLERGEDPNQTNSAGETALILAVQRGFEKAVVKLLKAGADPFITGGHYTSFRTHALGFANKQGQLPIIKRVLEAITLDTVEKIMWVRSLAWHNGYTSLLDDIAIQLERIDGHPALEESLPPLIQTIYRDDFAGFKKLLAKGANLDEALPNGLGPLHQSIRLQRNAHFDALLENQADINQCNSYSPLFIAVKFQNRHAYRELLKRGAQDLPSSQQHTALFAAVYLNDLEVIQDLVARGSDLNQYAVEGYFTLVYAAARHGRLDALKVLLSLGLKPDMKVNVEDNTNFDMMPGCQLTALSASVKNGDAEGVELLLKAGADPNRQSAGIPPLFFAAPAYRYPESETVDYWAVVERSCAIIDLLIDHGANVNLKSHDGSICLIQAILSGQEEIALHLIKRGAVCNVRDKNGKFPVDYAQYTVKAKLVHSGYAKASGLCDRKSVNID